MTDSERNANGQFAKGHTGNPNGRPPKVVPRHRLPHVNRRTIFEVAEMRVPMRSKDGTDLGEVSIYRGVMLALGQKAMEGNIAAQRLFLQHVNEAASVHGPLMQYTASLMKDNDRLREDIDTLRAIFPKFDGTGTVIMQPDGTVLPVAWDAAIKSGKLKMPRLNIDEDEGIPEEPK